MLLCRRRSGRSRDGDRRTTRDRSRDRGYPHRHNDKSRQADRRTERHLRALERDAKGSQNERGRAHRGVAKDADRGRERDKDSRRGGSGGSQQRDVRGKEEFAVNACGVLVSPDNLERAKAGRQVRTVKGEWLSARDSGIAFTSCRVSTTRPILTGLQLHASHTSSALHTTRRISRSQPCP